MPDTPARVAVRFRESAERVAEVERLAAVETEGNASQMFRKLIGEALAARGIAVDQRRESA